MIISGLISNGATTDISGVFSQARICPSVVPKANVMSSSVYINVSTSPLPAAPPARISMSTPVGWPSRDQRPGDDLVVGVDLVVVAEEVVHRAVLGFGEPIGLDHDRLRADRRAEVDRRLGAPPTPWTAPTMAALSLPDSAAGGARIPATHEGPTAGRLLIIRVLLGTSVAQRPPPDFESYHFPITACCKAPKDKNTVIPSSDDMMTAASSCSP